MWFKKKQRDPLMSMGKDSLTFLGKGSQFTGAITFEGVIRIDGRLDGEIHTKGTLVVGEHAVIEGDVNADVAIIGGRVAGTVIAREKVHLLATGAVIGTIKTQVFLVEEGACFMGDCEASGWGEVRALDGRKGAVSKLSQAVGAGSRLIVEKE